MATLLFGSALTTGVPALPPMPLLLSGYLPGNPAFTAFLNEIQRTSQDSFVRPSDFHLNTFAGSALQGAAVTEDGKLWVWGPTLSWFVKASLERLRRPVHAADHVAGVGMDLLGINVVMTDGTLRTNRGDAGHGEAVRGSAGENYDVWQLPAVLSQVTAIQAGGVYHFATSGRNLIFAWPLPEVNKQPVLFLPGVAQLFGNVYVTYALLRDGSLWGWGNGESFGTPLDHGSQVRSATPVKILEGVTDVSIGMDQVLALKKDGSVWGWGDNFMGGVGNGTKDVVLTPVKVLDAVHAIVAGDHYSLALRRDGSLWAWGRHQFDLGGRTSSLAPEKIMGGVAAIAPTSSRPMFLKADGTLWAWGKNDGALGDGTNIDRASPVQILEHVKLPQGALVDDHGHI